MTKSISNLKAKRSRKPAALVKSLPCLLAILALLGCHRNSGADNSVVSFGAPTGNYAIAVSAASSSQCINGGSIYSVYIDTNNNGVYDSFDTLVSQQDVCNGAVGATGASTVIGLDRVSVDTSVCASSAGLQVSSGLDLNRNGALDANEVTQTQIVCDGAQGAAGAIGAAGSAGTAGSNGHGVVFSLTAADSNTCPAGGTTILMALDVSDSGLYSALDPNQQSTTICNGTDGANGANGINGQAPAYTPVEPIMPCGNTVSYKEVLLRLSDGQILSSFSDSASGVNTRLAFLTDGSYIDTDGSGCNFSIATDGSTRSISWFGQVQMSWPLSQ